MLPTQKKCINVRQNNKLFLSLAVFVFLSNLVRLDSRLSNLSIFLLIFFSRRKIWRIFFLLQEENCPDCMILPPPCSAWCTVSVFHHTSCYLNNFCHVFCVLNKACGKLWANLFIALFYSVSPFATANKIMVAFHK